MSIKLLKAIAIMLLMAAIACVVGALLANNKSGTGSAVPSHRNGFQLVTRRRSPTSIVRQCAR